MGRNHKKVILETLETAQDLGIDVQFNNFSGGEWLKDYATSVSIDGKSMNGLQSWDNKDFRQFFIPYLVEYSHGTMKFDNIVNSMKGSKTSSTRNKDGHVEYAKDSYHWAKIDLMDKWHDYCELIIDCDFDNLIDIDIEQHRKSLKTFLLNVMKKTVECNPCMRGWSAERLEDCYITHGILPKFVKEQLQVDLKNDELQELKKSYLSHNPELFADCLHRLTGDTMVQDDLLYRMGYIGDC